ncbi:hypothetical protein GCM10027614_36150 [Micromonospora vulcania]
MLTARAGGQLVEDPPQCGPAEPTQRLRAERKAIGVTGHPALPPQLPLQLAQPPDVVGGVPAQRTGHRVDVDIVQSGPGVLLVELVQQVVQLADLAQRAGRVGVVQRLIAPDPLAAPPPQIRSQRPQVGVERGQLAGQPVAERLLHEPGKLGALPLGERVHQPLPGRRTAGQHVDQLVDGLRPLREEVAVPPHELGERVGGVLRAGVPGQQVVQVAHHLGELLLRGRVGGGAYRVAQPGEALTQHVVAELVENLLVRPAGVRAGPLVVGQLLHRPRGGAGQIVQHRLGEPRRVVVAAPQLVELGGERLVEQCPSPGHRAIQIAPPQRLPAQSSGPGGQVVQTATPLWATAQQVAQRVAQAATGQHLGADRVHCLTHVVRGRERIGTAAPLPVPETVAGHGQLRPP